MSTRDGSTASEVGVRDDVPPADDTLTAPFTRLDAGAVIALVRDGWGLDVSGATRLATERDDSYLVTCLDGPRIVKVAHPLDDPGVLDLQCAALAHAGGRDLGLPLPKLVADVDGAVLRTVTGADGEPRQARLLTYLSGSPLDYAATSSAQRRAVGTAAGRLSLALADLEHPAADRVLAWDLQQVGTLRPLLRHVSDPAVRAAVDAELAAYDDGVGAALRATRQQVVHHDLNADNLLVESNASDFVTGILDFGDVVRSSVVGDLAVAMAYAVGSSTDDEDSWAAAYDIADGFQAVRPLDHVELALLPALVRTRMAQRLLLNSWLAASDPANAGYTGRSITRAGQTLLRLAGSPSPLDRTGA